MISELIVIAENIRDEETCEELKKRAIESVRSKFIDKISIKSIKIKEEHNGWFLDDDNYIKDSYSAILYIEGNWIYFIRQFLLNIKVHLCILCGLYEEM